MKTVLQRRWFEGLLVILPALALFLVACSDLRTAPSIRADLDCTGTACSGGAYTFKVQSGSTWYSLTEVGDQIATGTGSNFQIIAQGSSHSVTQASIATDTVGYGNLNRQLFIPQGMFGSSASWFDVNQSGGIGNFAIVPGGTTAGTDTLSLYAIAGDPLDPDSIEFRRVLWRNGSKLIEQFYWQSAFDVDVSTGSFRFAKCSSTPYCTWAN